MQGKIILHVHNWGRVADASRRPPDDTEADIPGAPQAQGIGKEVAGGPGVVRAKEPQQRVRPSEEREAGPDPSQGGEADSLEVLPAHVRACPYGCVSEEHGQLAGRPLLVV